MMNRRSRRSIRLKGYDYSRSGWYFITICAAQRLCLFGDIVDGEMIPNDFGKIVIAEWERSAKIREEIEFDGWILMPTHLHNIVVIDQTMDRGIAPGNHGIARRKPRSLSTFIAGFKGATTRQINQHRNTPRETLWQRNDYEHSIRTETALLKIREYIENNPHYWQADQLPPTNQPLVGAHCHAPLQRTVDNTTA